MLFRPLRKGQNHVAEGSRFAGEAAKYSRKSGVVDTECILTKGPYLPCVSMAGWALLAEYPRHIRKPWLHRLINWLKMAINCSQMSLINSVVNVCSASHSNCSQSDTDL